jgi:hypothetical protein
MSHKTPRVLALALVLVILASPAIAYTIFMKDGSTIIAKREYRIDGENVIITLQNGTETFLAIVEIDVEKTKAFNKDNFGSAVLLEGGEIKALTTHRPIPKQTLGDLIVSGDAKPRPRQEARRPTAQPAGSGPEMTAAGYVDLSSVRRYPYDNLDLMSELRSHFTSQGLEAQVFRGTTDRGPMVQVTTSSESAVFKSLQVASQAMAQLGQRYPGRLQIIEMVLQTSRGTSGGQFVIDTALAEEINSNATDMAAIFVENVQF